MSTASESPRRMQNVEIANIRARSYLWQPWFAHVNGTLDLITSKESTSGGEGRNDSARSNAIAGGGGLTLFPTSRFPFSGSLLVSDSRASGELTSSNQRNTRLSLRQSYRPAEGTDSYSLAYDRGTLESSSFGRDTVQALSGSASQQRGDHSFYMDGNHSQNNRSSGGQGSTLSLLTARHGYRPDEALSVDNLLSYNTSAIRAENGGVSLDQRTQFFQFNSFASWQPDEDVPLQLSGGGRFFHADTSQNTLGGGTSTLSGNVAARYQPNRNLSLTGSGVVAQNTTGADSRLITSQSAAVAYVPDALTWGEYRYRWNTTAAVANTTGSQDGARQNVNLSAGHGLTRDLTLSPTSGLMWTLGQNVSTGLDSQSEMQYALQHDTTLSWRITPAPASSMYMSAQLADSVNLSGPRHNRFQLLNLQASGQLQFTRYSVGSANITFQATRQEASDTSGTSTSTNTAGNLSYQHGRLFDIPRLRYVAVYTTNESQSKSRLLGDINAGREQISNSFEQRLEYRIGRLDLRLSARFATIDERRHSMVFLRLNRDFGDF